MDWRRSMTVNQSSEKSQEKPSVVDLLDELMKFDGAPEQFLLRLLGAQCEIGSASGGAVIRLTGEGKPQLVASYPILEKDQTAPLWLAKSVAFISQVVEDQGTVVAPIHSGEELYGQGAKSHLILVPLKSETAVRGAMAFVVESGDLGFLHHAKERLELTVGLLSLYEMRLTLDRRQGDMKRLRQALELVAEVNKYSKAKAGMMSFVNVIASCFSADRVSLGFLRGRYVKLTALSHTEKFARKMKLVQGIESAMEECLDQDVEVLYPCHEAATYVCKAAKELSVQHGPAHVLCLPLRKDDEVFAVLVIERSMDKPFELSEIEGLRLTCDLCAVRLGDLHDHDKWVGLKLIEGMRRVPAWFVGAKHTWVKVATIFIAVGLLLAVVLKGNDYVSAPFTFKLKTKRHVAVPFNGRLVEVLVEEGDRVKAGERIARLDTKVLEAEKQAKGYALSAYHKEAAVARNENKTAEKQIALARALQIEAEIIELDEKLRLSTIRSPIDGTVILGDLKSEIGAPVELGQVLFQIAPLHKNLYGELLVPEGRIKDIDEYSRLNHNVHDGELAAQGLPDLHIRFKIRRISPVAEILEKQNAFKVRVDLLSPHLDKYVWIRQGVSGLAKIKVGEKPYVELWTRDMVDWLRMKLWVGGSD